MGELLQRQAVIVEAPAGWRIVEDENPMERGLWPDEDGVAVVKFYLVRAEEEE